MSAVDAPGDLELALAERTRQVTLLADVGRALAGDGSLAEQLACVAKAVLGTLDARGVAVWIGGGDDLELRCTVGALPAVAPAILRRVRTERRPVVDVIDGAAWVGTPLRVDDAIVGVLGVVTAQPLSSSFSDVLGTIGDQLALAIARSASLDDRLRLVALVEDSGDFIGYCNLDGQPLFLNDAGLRLLGVPDLAALRERGVSAVDLFVAEDRAQFVDGASTARRQGRWEGTLRLRRLTPPPAALDQHPDVPAAVDVALNLFTLKDRITGETTALAIVGRDLRQQKADEQALRDLAGTLERRVAERTRELEDSNHELEAFSYSVSHDLRAPIRHINGFSEMLQKNAGDKLDARGVHYLTTIALAAKQAATLIDDLLAFSRVARTELMMRDVDLNVLAASVQRDVSNEAPGRTLQWKIGKLPKVVGDPAMLRLVLRNMMSNAVKYTRPQPLPVIEVEARETGNEVQISVRDNGVGFDMQHVGKLFGVFQRLHRSEEFEGTGIGLANVRRIVHRHGGRTFAVGAVGAGATFTFTLPLRPSPTPGRL